MAETEQQIATRLAQSIAPPPSTDDEPVEPTQEDREPLHNNLPLEGAITKQELMDYFNLSPTLRHGAETAQAIETIMEWAKTDSGSTDLAALLKSIRFAELGLGSTLKPDRLQRLYRFVRLNQQHALLNEKMRALYA